MPLHPLLSTSTTKPFIDRYPWVRREINHTWNYIFVYLYMKKNKIYTLLKFNIAPENSPSPKEIFQPWFFMGYVYEFSYYKKRLVSEIPHPRNNSINCSPSTEPKSQTNTHKATPSRIHSDLVIEFWTQTHLNTHPWKLLVGRRRNVLFKLVPFSVDTLVIVSFPGAPGALLFYPTKSALFPPDFKSSSWLEILQAPPDLGNGRTSRPDGTCMAIPPPEI